MATNGRLERVFTVGELEKRLKAGGKAIRSLIRTGKLRAVRVGTGFRISESALEDFLHGQRKVTNEN
jgi:excisionase family DNA binding protein